MLNHGMWINSGWVLLKHQCGSGCFGCRLMLISVCLCTLGQICFSNWLFYTSQNIFSSSLLSQDNSVFLPNLLAASWLLSVGQIICLLTASVPLFSTLLWTRLQLLGFLKLFEMAFLARLEYHLYTTSPKKFYFYPCYPWLKKRFHTKLNFP